MALNSFFVPGLNPISSAERLGTVMSPVPGDPTEAWGVLNPATIRGRDGELYLFARVVAPGNFSRIRIGRVLFKGGRPAGLERLGFALTPQAPYELRGDGEGGCEDPRIVYLPCIDQYVMTYTAFGPTGARVAIAVSDDLFSWERLGLVNFGTENGIDFNGFDNKDAFFFPQPVMAPDGTLSLALMHRPMTGPDRFWNGRPSPHFADLPSSIWVSYVPLDMVLSSHLTLTELGQHRLVLTPYHGWEHVKVGGGAPPLPWGDNWLLIYHGIKDLGSQTQGRRLRYAAGAFVVGRHNVQDVLWRSPEPFMVPETPNELCGVVNNVVFPTGVDQITDNVVDVYYGMADAHIGVARITLQTVQRPDAAVA